MKVRLLAAVIACALGHGAALADITARYRLVSSESMVVQVNDRGDSRISASRHVALVTRDGAAYFVITDRLGTYAVREADVRADAEMDASPLSAWFAIGRAPRPDSATYLRPVDEGSQRIAGRIGVRWRIGPGPRRWRDPSSIEHDSDYVISSDATLAPIGAVLSARFEEAADRYELRLYPAGVAGILPPDLHAIVRSGTIVRIGNLVRLRRVHMRPVPASAFALPSTILTREQFLHRSAATAWPLN